MENKFWSPYDEIFGNAELTAAEKITLVTLVIERNKYISDKKLSELTTFKLNYTRKILSSLRKKGFITSGYEEYKCENKRMIYFTNKTKELLYYIDFSKGE